MVEESSAHSLAQTEGQGGGYPGANAPTTPSRASPKPFRRDNFDAATFNDAPPFSHRQRVRRPHGCSFPLSPAVNGWMNRKNPRSHAPRNEDKLRRVKHAKSEDVRARGAGHRLLNSTKQLFQIIRSPPAGASIRKIFHNRLDHPFPKSASIFSHMFIHSPSKRVCRSPCSLYRREPSQLQRQA